jgi:hypothetical protein
MQGLRGAACAYYMYGNGQSRCLSTNAPLIYTVIILYSDAAVLLSTSNVLHGKSATAGGGAAMMMLVLKLKLELNLQLTPLLPAPLAAPQ